MLACTYEDVVGAMDAVIDECLTRAAIDQPPVDPSLVRDALEVVHFKHCDPDRRGSSYTRPEGAFVSVRPESRPERWNWSLGHEIGEICMEAMERRLGADIEQPFRESICSAFASRLLVPTRWFERDCFRLSFDLPKLKARYSTASNEVIARRMLEVDAPALITVWDGNVRGWRKPNPRTPVQDVERRAQAKAHRTGKPARISEGALTADAWPIHEGSRKREIVRLTWDDTA